MKLENLRLCKMFKQFFFGKACEQLLQELMLSGKGYQHYVMQDDCLPQRYQFHDKT